MYILLDLVANNCSQVIGINANETSPCVNRPLCQILTLFQKINVIVYAVNWQTEILGM